MRIGVQFHPQHAHDADNRRAANELIKGRAQQVTLGFKGPDFDMSVTAKCLTWRDQPTAA